MSLIPSITIRDRRICLAAVEMDVSVTKTIDQDMIAAMKARDAERLSTIRMMKTALKNKEIDKREPLTDAEAYQVLTTMIKQRRESIEQFTKGGRTELAAKEASEITVIEGYLPKSASEDEIRALVTTTIVELSSGGAALGPKDMGAVMKKVQEKIKESGTRADGKVVSEMVKAELAG
jgi:uncharacterized protein